jgi:hypothetical protein
MPVIEAQRASILVPHDHRHISSRASVEVNAPPGHLCVNEVLLHAGDGYWARRVQPTGQTITRR